MNSKGMLIVITAPSGSGKTTIYKELLRRRKDLVFSVSYTTRKKRASEVNGVDYFFIDREDFERKIKNQEFFEWAQVYGELYGTEKKQIYEYLNIGKLCLLDVDIKGALNIIKEYPDAVTIFIEPPNFEELERRLRERGTESNEKMRLRLFNARNELENKKYFKYIVVNDVVEKAVDRIQDIIEKERRMRG